MPGVVSLSRWAAGSLAMLFAGLFTGIVPALASGPNPFDFPEAAISRAGSPHEWPFAVDAGSLVCVTFNGQRGVLFSEPWRTDVPLGNRTPPRSVIVSTNPVALFASYEDRALYLPFDTLETLIRRLAPFETMGLQLCEPAGSSPQDL